MNAPDETASPAHSPAQSPAQSPSQPAVRGSGTAGGTPAAAALASGQMRAVVVTRHGGPEVLDVRTLPVPTPGPGQLLVAVAGAGINFRDVYQREGSYATNPPFVQSTEFAGTVVAVGEQVREFAAGDRVATLAGAGAQAQLALVNEAAAVPVPEDIDLQVAAAALLQAVTAHYLTRSTFPVQPGHRVLVHAAAGGVGALLVQLAKATGARVIATVGSEAKVAIARDAGADEVIRYDQVADLSAAIRAACGITGTPGTPGAAGSPAGTGAPAGPAGIHVAYDGVGAATFEASLASLRPRGMLVVFGASSGAVPPIDPQRLNAAGSVFLTRPKIDEYVADRAELLWRASEVFAAISAGTLRIAIGGRYSLEQTADAYRDLQARRTTGKLLVIP